MPIKVRCEGCQAVLNVPDQAAGKVLKCKQCGGRVKVPGGSPAAAGAAPAKPKRPKPAESAPADPDDIFGGLDLRQMEDTKKKICPGCAAPVKDEDIECPKCGVNISTGVLSERQRIRIERKGPPPEEFYRDVWGNAWKFLKKHWSYAVRTAVVWSVCLSMAMTCAYSLRYYVTTRQAALEEMVKGASQNVKVSGNKLIITVGKEKGSNVLFDGTFHQKSYETWAPHILPWTEPPAMFWIGMTAVFQLGFGGWCWTMANAITATTMAGEKRIKRFQFDFFANLTMGIRFYAWPSVLTAPLMVLPAALYFVDQQIAAAVAGGIFVIIPLLVLPAAVVHMAQHYSFRAWLLFWMLRDFAKTAGASLYVFGMMIFLVLLIPGGIVGGIAAAGPRVATWLLSQESSVLKWLTSFQDMGEGNLRFLFYQMPLVFGASFAFYFVVCTLVAFPAIFMMRVIGLYGVYFRADLALVQEFAEFEVAGFGPRYLAYLVDNIIMILLAGVGQFVGACVNFLFTSIYGWAQGPMIAQGVAGLATFILWGMYFSYGESGSARATLGKWSVGLIVLREDNKPQTRQQAFSRAASALVSVLTLYIGFLMCLFRPDKKAMHDLMSKSKVVWRTEQT
ncbi:MAG: RDD family protein [Planctomycetaceae bacterium]|nr:RDD family protein [Planctomycetaceae bacterium]